MSDEAPGVVEAYRALLTARVGASAGQLRPGADELLTGRDSVRPGSRDLAASVDLLGVRGLLARLHETARLVEDDGVTYGVAVAVAPSPPSLGATPATDDAGTDSAPDPDGGDSGGSDSGGSGGGSGSGTAKARARARDLNVDGGIEATDTIHAPGGRNSGPYHGPSGTQPWTLDPLPVVIAAEEWQHLRAGLRQRAELLDAVLTDLYGPRDLLRHGILPPEIVYGHAGFIRQGDQVRVPGPRQLFFTGTDLARGEDGAWFVIGDRTQAPSGAGYAMENRRVVSRVMTGLYRDTPLERLRAFFDTMRTGLQEVAPATAEAPRVVLLTPGSGSETAFDQAFLSTLLGYPLVEGRDLTVREGRVWLRSLGRLEPVDVVLRRVDNWFTDPLELRPDSRLGVAGLLEASRRGSVSVVNTIGAGVLENPGLLPFLPAAARHLLDAPLALPSTPTWWCGDPVSRDHVLAHLPDLVVRPISRGRHGGSRMGWEQSAEQLDVLRRRIEAEPHAWCGQAPLGMSTVPAVTAAGLEPRRMVLRTFAVAQGGRYHLMTGGLARVAARADSHDVTSRGGALAKDVWVLTPQTVGVPRPAPASSDTAVLVATGTSVMSARVAADLFWLGRYSERAENAARLLRVVSDVAEDHSRRPGSAGSASLAVLLESLTHVTTTYPGFVGTGAAGRLAAPQAELLRLAVDGSRPGTLAYAVRRTVDSAHAVREQLSQDTWLVLGSLDRRLGELASRAGDVDVPVQPTLSQVLEGLLALAGLSAESLVRDAGWYFMDAGRRVERSLHLVALLRRALAQERSPAVDDLVVESVLIASESIITHRRRHPGRVSVPTVLDLLVTDRTNPRGLSYQLERLADDLRHLPGGSGEEAEQRGVLGQVRDVAAALREVDLAGRDADERGRVFEDVAARLLRVAETIVATHFTLGVPPQPLPATPVVDVR